MFDSKELQGFLKLSDEEIQNVLEKAAIAAGADKNKVKSLISNPDKIRSLVSTMTPDDAERLVNLIGKDKAQTIANSLKSNL